MADANLFLVVVIVVSICWKVAERVLSFWGNEYIAAMISDNIAVILPILYPSLFEITKSHWNPQIVQLTQSVMRYLHDNNQPLYDDISAKYRQNLYKYVKHVVSLNMLATSIVESDEHLSGVYPSIPCLLSLVWMRLLGRMLQITD